MVLLLAACVLGLYAVAKNEGRGLGYSAVVLVGAVGFFLVIGTGSSWPTGALLLGTLFGLLVGGWPGAELLRAAAKWVQKADVGSGDAYATVLIAAVANFILGVVLGSLVRALAPSQETVIVVWALTVPLGFAIQSGIVSWQLHIPLSRACLISLTMYAVVVGLCFLVGVILFAIDPSFRAFRTHPKV